MKSGPLKVTDLSSLRRDDTPRVTGTAGQDRPIDQAPRRRRRNIIAGGVAPAIVAAAGSRSRAAALRAQPALGAAGAGATRDRHARRVPARRGRRWRRRRGGQPHAVLPADGNVTFACSRATP
jgi:hypothetical protein